MSTNLRFQGLRFLGGMIISAGIVVAIVHYQQKRDISEMRKGVERDRIRVAAKKSHKDTFGSS